MAVDRHTDLRRVYAADKPVEHQSAVVPDSRNSGVEVSLCRAFRPSQKVKVVPADESAVIHPIKEVPPLEGLGLVGGQLEHQPPTGRHHVVEVPAQHRQHGVLLRGDGQSSTLRQRCSLETEAESTEVRLTPGLVRALCRQLHRTDSFVTVHTIAIVEDGDPLRPVVRREEVNSARVGRDRVVDNVSDRGLEGVSDRPHRLKEERIWRELDVTHCRTPECSAVPTDGRDRGLRGVAVRSRRLPRGWDAGSPNRRARPVRRRRRSAPAPECNALPARICCPRLPPLSSRHRSSPAVGSIDNVRKGFEHNHLKRANEPGPPDERRASRSRAV